MKPDKQQIVAALKTVYDPEIPVDIYELGLIYDIVVGEDSSVEIRMTLTAPNCPIADEVVMQVYNAVMCVAGVGKVNVELVFEPMWTPDRMSEEAKVALNM